MSSPANDSSDATINSSASLDDQLESRRQKRESSMTYFTAKISSLDKDLHNERNYRINQLTKIDKILLRFENKLKSEQKHIRQKLCEKDLEISRLTSEIANLREKYGDGICIDDRATDTHSNQYCLECGKQYHQTATKDVGVQFDSPVGYIAALDSEKEYSSKRQMSRRSISCEYDRIEPHGSWSSRIHSFGIDQVMPDSGEQLQQCTQKDNADTSNTPSDDIEQSRNTQENRTSQASQDKSFLKKYEEAFPVETSVESSKDWYVSTSDIDDSDNVLSKPYGNNAVNPVLECVNQILLQQTMDSIMDPLISDHDVCRLNSEVGNDAPRLSKNDTNNNSKDQQRPTVRHPDTQQVLRRNSAAIIPTSTSANEHRSVPSSNLSYATVHSNDYEIVRSDRTSTNFYIDMESKIGQEDINTFAKSKQPPALPPKPANLLNLRQVLKTLPVVLTRNYDIIAETQMDTASEPDYCSISEVQETIKKNVQIVVDVHKTVDDAASSHQCNNIRTEATDEVFADVPKLPNVTAIISPKKNHFKRYSPKDASIVRTSPPIKPKPAHLQPNAKFLPHFLSEINGNVLKPTSKVMIPRKMTTIVENVKSRPTTTVIPFAKPNEKAMMPMQAEFDWYNLDAEYGKLIHVDSSVNDVDYS